MGAGGLCAGGPGIEVLRALRPGPSTSPYNGTDNDRPGADSHASVVPKDGEHCRLVVAALFDGELVTNETDGVRW